MENVTCGEEDYNAGLHIVKMMSWNELTATGKHWFAVSGAKSLSVSTPETYEHYLGLYEQNPTEEVMLDADIRSGRSDPKCYKGMIGYAYINNAPQNFRTNLENIIKAFSAKYLDIGYCQGMDRLCVWMLLFMDESSAFWILCRLVEGLLEPGYFAGASFAMNGFFVECSVLEHCC